MGEQRFGGRIDEGEGHWRPDVDQEAFAIQRQKEIASDKERHTRRIERESGLSAHEAGEIARNKQREQARLKRLREQKMAEVDQLAKEAEEQAARAQDMQRESVVQTIEERGKRSFNYSQAAEEATGLKGAFLRFRERLDNRSRANMLDRAMDEGLRPSEVSSADDLKKTLLSHGRREGGGYKRIYQREGAQAAERSLKEVSTLRMAERLALLLKGDFFQPHDAKDLYDQWQQDRATTDRFWYDRKDPSGNRISPREARRAFARLRKRRGVI